MKHLESKTKISTIALILLLTLSAIIVALPAATAQDTYPSFPVLSLIPDEAGVGQEVLLSMGITRQTAWPQSGWKGLTVTVTKPDGSIETLGPINTDTTGLGGTVYIPIGTFYISTSISFTSSGSCRCRTCSGNNDVCKRNPRSYFGSL